MNAPALLKIIIWIFAAETTLAWGLSLPKPFASLSNVRNFDEQIQLAYKPEVEEPFRPGRFLVDNDGDDDFTREDRAIKLPKLARKEVTTGRNSDTPEKLPLPPQTCGS
ncbi:hypothetical protein GEV33_015485 [Tenebrio molitor]|uniref:Uncharacterized protein n=1 Tax=Tenebrio molitor TaxID=7067 RepID=A0A8J6LB49_TENMO|nr:hypothetical protein GEV33_015486 [Tenebrio molitor]KAH0807306.1 hypothetical protein GEV33_015485 [Tenebrio molitor]